MKFEAWPLPLKDIGGNFLLNASRRIYSGESKIEVHDQIAVFLHAISMALEQNPQPSAETTKTLTTENKPLELEVA